MLAGAVAFQALAGEPVTLFTTTALAGGFSLLVPLSSVIFGTRRVRDPAPKSWRGPLPVYLLVSRCAAIQIVPMVQAAVLADRSTTIVKDVWSLQPGRAARDARAASLRRLLHACSRLADAPWIPIVNAGREPFFFSLYFGGSAPCAGALRAGRGLTQWLWGVFWAAAGGMSIVLAFGVNTPVYPFLRDHLPILGVVPVSREVPGRILHGRGRRHRRRLGCACRRQRARATSRPSIGALARMPSPSPFIVAALAGALAAASTYAPAATAARASSFARALGVRETADAGKFMSTALSTG